MTLQQFISEHGITVVAKRIDKRTDIGSECWEKVAGARHWELTLISTDFGPADGPFYFSQGSAHAATPSARDLLECMKSDTYGFHGDDGYSFDDFCSDFGYDEDSRKGERIYKECKRKYCRLEAWMCNSAALDAFYECEEPE